MENKNLVSHLKDLVHLDIDAIHAYDQAIEKINVKEVKDALTNFRDDHRRHVDELSAIIRSHGEEPPRFARDFKGFLIQGFTALRSITGTEGALRAMKSNEQLTNVTYVRALSWDLPENVRSIVEKNREDERRHLDAIEDFIRREVWKEGRQDVA